jgi:hypothetical protein
MASQALEVLETQRTTADSLGIYSIERTAGGSEILQESSDFTALHAAHDTHDTHDVSFTERIDQAETIGFSRRLDTSTTEGFQTSELRIA